MKFLIYFLLLVPCLSRSQNDPPVSSIESLASSQENELETEDEDLEAAVFRGRKFDLNTVTPAQLQTIPGITNKLANNLVNYRNEMGAFTNLYEMQAVPEWSASICRKVKSYFTIDDNSNSQQLLKRVGQGKHSVSIFISTMLRRSKGYIPDEFGSRAYIGSPLRGLLKYHFNNPGKIQWGFLAEKDGGEKLFSNASLGPDHYSLYLAVQRWKKFESLTLGDYRVNLGQGLIQWQSLAFNKSAEVISTLRQADAIRPNRSTAESGFYRGIAASRKFNRLSAVFFFSRIKRDANLKEGSLNAGHISSLLNQGLHRTEGELSDRKTITHTTLGLAAGYKLDKGKVGVNFLAHSFNKAIVKADEPYNRFAFSGSRLLNSSFDYTFTLGNALFFGELAMAHPGSFAMVQGMLLSIAHNTDLTILHRNISPSYHSFESSPFTEASDPAGEKGLFAGIQIKLTPALAFSAFADHFSFPFYRYRLHGAGRGNSYLLQLKISPDKKSHCLVRFSSERKNLNNSDEEFIHKVGLHQRKSLRIHSTFPVNEKFTGQSRLEVAEIKTEEKAVQHSLMLFAELTGKIKKRYSLAIRAQFIDIPDYESRLYAYESSGATSGYVQMFYGTGWRFSVRAKGQLSRNLMAWTSVSNTIFSSDSAMGSGNDKVPGRQKGAISIQATYTFN